MPASLNKRGCGQSRARAGAAAFYAGVRVVLKVLAHVLKHADDEEVHRGTAEFASRLVGSFFKWRL